jgi:hypothetical protein
MGAALPPTVVLVGGKGETGRKVRGWYAGEAVAAGRRVVVDMVDGMVEGRCRNEEGKKGRVGRDESMGGGGRAM